VSIALTDEYTVSNCCGTHGRSVFNSISFEQAGLCSKCGEHCEYVPLEEETLNKEYLMQQQLIIELFQLLGSQSVDFTGNPLKVKMSPHTPPQIITRAMIDNRVIQVEVDGKVKAFNELDTPAKQTIGQRLRLMLAETQNR
jgi:hypothetical protein